MSSRILLDFEACRAIADGEMHAYAGRTMIGTILRCGRSFMAFNTDDRHQATAANIRDAMRALSSAPASIAE